MAVICAMAARNTSPHRSIELNSEEELQKLAARIRALRVAAGYSSYEYFAYDHGFSRAQFGRYEQGQDLRFTSLVRIASAFGLTLPEFFAEGF
jgi:transcriptional regulator with XRE-family HTH domain